MIKRDIAQLAVYPIETDVEYIPLERLQRLYMDKTSEIIYITKEEKMYGIICMGEALQARRNGGGVKINKNFTVLNSYNVIKAREIFQNKGNIHKIPVVNEQGKLLGDYSRWDDMLYVERNQGNLMKEKELRNVFAMYENVYTVKPAAGKFTEYLCLKSYFEKFEIEFTELEKRDIGEKLEENSICLFLDEDERRGIQCAYGLMPYSNRDWDGKVIFNYDLLGDDSWNIRLATYKSLMMQIMREVQLESLGIKKGETYFNDRLDDKITFVITRLRQEGVQCFCFNEFEERITEYGKDFMKAAQKRVEETPLNEKDRLWPEGTKRETFYGELYKNEDYEKGIVQKELYESVLRYDYQKKIDGKYFNSKEGRRITSWQPDKYAGTIYLLGPCTVVGLFVEDQHTISSFLQKELLENGFQYRVENYGSISRPDTQIGEIKQFYDNDILIYFSNAEREIRGAENGSLEKIFERHCVPCEWVTDRFVHCNHKANQLIAEDVLEMVEPYLNRVVERKNRIQICCQDIITEYIRRKYLKHFFDIPSLENVATIGAIVMNGNPFSIGHHYLIEQASQKVELLIIFVVEEDASLFTFEERYKLIKEGTKDICNVLVVPSGEFILSKNNFQEYFIKEEDKETVYNAEYDVTVFAEHIAKALHITHRFVGEEPEDRVTDIYNKAMKAILPQKGIKYVEIPRLSAGDEVISASRIRKYLREEEYEKAFAMLPETTIHYILEQI